MCQTDLKGELVLLLVCKREALTHNISQVVLHKLHSLRESLLNFIFRCSIIVITTRIRQQKKLKLIYKKKNLPIILSYNESSIPFNCLLTHQ